MVIAFYGAERTARRRGRAKREVKNVELRQRCQLSPYGKG